MVWSGKIKVNDYIEGICAIHLSSYVGSPYKDRGGLMIVGPPGVLKTTLVDVLDDNYHNALSISNSYMSTMRNLMSSFFNGQVRSLCFPDLQSVYAGDPRTSGRIEQMMMQLSGEATRTIGGDQDARYAKFKGYCTIFACMTDKFYTDHANKWENSGFHRRFLWSTYTLHDPDILIRAIMQWTRASLGSTIVPQLPASGLIMDCVSTDERQEIYRWIRHQPIPHEIQFQVLCKSVSALRWHYHEHGIKKDAMETMHAFAETLQRDAALMIIPDQEFDLIERRTKDNAGSNTKRRTRTDTKRKSTVRRKRSGTHPNNARNTSRRKRRSSKPTKKDSSGN
jgi:hypothetical protein